MMCADTKGENLTRRAQHEHRRGHKAPESAEASSCPVTLAVGPWEGGSWGEGGLKPRSDSRCHAQAQEGLDFIL